MRIWKSGEKAKHPHLFGFIQDIFISMEPNGCEQVRPLQAPLSAVYTHEIYIECDNN